MEPLTSKLRYEEPSYIEEYVAELTHLKHSSYKQRLDLGIIIGKYFLLKRYGNPRKKSLRLLPPRAYFGTTSLTGEDLEWKLKFGPYALAKYMPIAPVIEDINRKLSEHGLFMREGSLENLLNPIFCKMREQYPEIIKNWECPDEYDPEAHED